MLSFSVRLTFYRGDFGRPTVRTVTFASPYMRTARLPFSFDRGNVVGGSMEVTKARPAWFLLTQHWVSLLSSALVATALLSWLFVLPLQIRGHASNPYVGIIVFLVLPFVFFTGLILVPIGIYLSKRRIREGFTQTKFDRRAALWRIVWFFVVVSAVNILIGTQLIYRAVTYMETPQFCRASCHTMPPEAEIPRTRGWNASCATLHPVRRDGSTARPMAFASCSSLC